MKVKIPKEFLALGMLLMGLIFVSSIFEQGPVIIGVICLILIICGVYVRFSFVQEGDYTDYDVIG
jgi:glucose uptake protein GlcU